MITKLVIRMLTSNINLYHMFGNQSDNSEHSNRRITQNINLHVVGNSSTSGCIMMSWNSQIARACCVVRCQNAHSSAPLFCHASLIKFVFGSLQFIGEDYVRPQLSVLRPHSQGSLPQLSGQGLTSGTTQEPSVPAAQLPLCLLHTTGTR
jgi:hypothetical protein